MDLFEGSIFVIFVVFWAFNQFLLHPLWAYFGRVKKTTCHSTCLKDHFETKWIFEMFFIFWFSEKTFRFLGHNFPIGLSKMQFTVHRNLHRKNLFLKIFLQYSINSGIGGNFFRIFENTSSKTAVKLAFDKSIGSFPEWIGKKTLYIFFGCSSGWLSEVCWKVSSSFINSAFSLSIDGNHSKGKFFLRRKILHFCWSLGLRAKLTYVSLM